MNIDVRRSLVKNNKQTLRLSHLVFIEFWVDFWGLIESSIIFTKLHEKNNKHALSCKKNVNTGYSVDSAPFSTTTGTTCLLLDS